MTPVAAAAAAVDDDDDVFFEGTTFGGMLVVLIVRLYLSTLVLVARPVALGVSIYTILCYIIWTLLLLFVVVVVCINLTSSILSDSFPARSPVCCLLLFVVARWKSK